MPKRTRLSKLRLDFVSLVDAGDNAHAEVVIHKRRNLDEDAGTDTTWGMPNGTQPGQLTAEALEALPEDVQKYINALEDHALQQEDVIKEWETKSTKGGKDADEDDEDEVEKVLKSAPPELAEFIRKQDERIAKAEQLAKAERDQRIAKEFVARAEAEFAHLAKPDVMGPILKAASEQLDDSTFGGLVEVLKRADAAASEIFVEKGYSTNPNDESTALSRLDQAVAKMRAADPTITEGVALAKALEIDPQAYDAYNREFMNKGGAR